MTNIQNADCEVPTITKGSLSDQLARVVRYGTTAIGGYLVAQGYTSQALVELVAGIVTTATPLLIGMALARIQRQHVANVVNTLRVSQSKSNSETPKGDSR